MSAVPLPNSGQTHGDSTIGSNFRKYVSS